MRIRSHGRLWLKTQARGPPASLPCRPGIMMLGAEEEKESNVTYKKEMRESCINVITYFHEIIKIQECGDIHLPLAQQLIRDVDGWMEKDRG